MKASVKLPVGVKVTVTKPKLQPGVPWTGYVHPNHLKPNPNQPRTVFPEEDQLALQRSHSKVGQQRAVYVMPFEDVSDSNIWFMIQDGERSWRSLTSLDSPAILVTYNPLVNPEDIDFQSFVANFGGKGHTHGETIDAVWKEIKIKGRLVKDFADAVTRSEVWVGNYLFLHNLHPELRKLLDPPTSKNKRLPFQLALTISKAEQSEQVAIYKKTLGMSSKTAIRAARKHVDEGTQVQGRSRKPSDDLKVLARILKTAEEDMGFLAQIPQEVLESPAFDQELIAAHLVVIATAVLKAHKRVTGKRIETLDASAVAKLQARRLFGKDGNKERSTKLDDIINSNGGRAAATL